jgi:hypothetical protein
MSSKIPAEGIANRVEKLECTECNRAIGPLYPIDADCSGWMCDECYKKYQLREFLSTVPDSFIFSEAGKRMAAKRTDAPRRPKVMRGCKFCGKFFGLRDMREHVAEAHPGGVRGGHKLLSNPPVGKQCKYCSEVHGSRAMRKHVQTAHPEKCRPEKRKVKIK